MKTHRFLARMRANKYFNDTHTYIGYERENGLILFLIDVDNILDEIYSKKMVGIRCNEQKELLEVLKFILDNYKLYSIESGYLKGEIFENNFHPKAIGPREAMVASLIYELRSNLGYYDEINLNICRDYLVRSKRYLQQNNISEFSIMRTLKSNIIFCSKYINI